MEKVVLIGGHGTAIVVADQIWDAHQRYGKDIEVLGLALDDHSGGDAVGGYPILCDIKDAYSKYEKYEDVKFLFLLYRPDVMHERAQLLKNLNIPIDKFTTFVHPSVMLAKSASIGVGNVLLANVVVNSCSRIGNFNIVHSGSHIAHDTTIGNNNFISAQTCVGSAITIGNENFMGLNASIRNGVSIGNNNIIGMASNVTKNIGDNSLWYGNPATMHPKLNHVIK